MWPQQHHLQRNQPPSAGLNPAHDVSGQSLKFDEDICLTTVPDLLERDSLSGGSLLCPVRNTRTRRRNVKDFVDKVSLLPPAPLLSADIVGEEDLSHSMVGEDDSVSAIFQDPTSTLLKTSCSKKTSSRVGHASFRGVDDELDALRCVVQRFEIGSFSSSLHGSTASLQMEEIDVKRRSASHATAYKL